MIEYASDRTGDPADEDAAAKSFRNIPSVQLVLQDELNAYDVLCSDWVVFSKDTLPAATTKKDGE